MKRYIFSCIFSAMLIAGTFAQSNAFVDSLLSEKKVNYGQVSYLVLVASDNLSEDADEGRAFELLETLNWAPKGVAIADSVPLAAYARILMSAFGMKGGVMYTLFPSSRYAYRELASLQVIQGRSDPSATVDGVAAVRMLGRIFDVMGLNK
ncbi:MAG: hypothetical protein WCT14_03685 [Treponemataceae bacterium]